ncbi:Hint domain-containing protein [Aliiroseovarius marinus]|uniref:Hint domain-containing protein n=1 Tax=Aliiroseovarius marinus TaxID=2500159 RepID=UPI003D7E34CD
MTYQTNKIAESASLNETMGLAEGTIVLTMRGEVAVEDLREGDRVITRDIGAQPLRAIKRRRAQTTHITKGSLGENRPERDLAVAAGQPLMVRDGAPVAMIAGDLTQDAGIPTVADLYQLDFGRRHVIYANGVELAVA